MSSYEENNYGNILRSFILANKPSLVVECGVLDGYSTMFIANALKFNRKKRGIRSIFFAYDLFDDYEYRHGHMDSVMEMLTTNNLDYDCNLFKANAFEIYNDYKDNSIDFLHFDISNDGDILLQMLNTWGKKIHDEGMIAFEGGSIERDQGWIKKYKKRPIRPELLSNPDVYMKWNIQILNPFPSMTLLWRRK
jgi:hypothetical protein